MLNCGCRIGDIGRFHRTVGVDASISDETESLVVLNGTSLTDPSEFTEARIEWYKLTIRDWVLTRLPIGQRGETDPSEDGN